MEKYYRNTETIDGEIDDNQVIMHIGRGKYLGLNSVGKRIWSLIEEPKTFEEILPALLLEYNISAEQCAKEVRTFLDKGVEFDIILKK